MPIKMEDIAIIVLAAGKSSRMEGGIKQLKKINNQYLLDIVLNKALELNLSNILCVLGAHKTKIKEQLNSCKGIQFVTNFKYNLGLSSSIQAGLQHLQKSHLKNKGVLVLLADQPAISISYLKSMVQLFLNNQDKIIASNYGHKIGVPAIFPEKTYPNLLLLEGDKGASTFLNNSKELILIPSSSSNFKDIDTLKDLEEINKNGKLSI